MTGIAQAIAANNLSIGAGNGDGSSSGNAGASALAIKQRTGTTTDGMYWVKPPNGSAVQVWCDMNTSGGGWMLVARTHPSGNITGHSWGWHGDSIGAATTYSNCYQLDLYSMYNNGFQFTSYIFGNQLTNDSNSWGPFIYQVGVYDSFITSDTQQTGTSYNTLKSDTNVYGTTEFPGMQGAIGFPVTGTSNAIYYMRDCCGFASYGITYAGMTTTYCSSSSPQWYCGPWCNGSTLSGNTWVQGGSSSPTNTGGTNQCMIMVR